VSKWRIAILAFLISAPFLFLTAYGAFRLWEDGWSFWLWWPMTASMALAYYLAWQWQKKQKLLKIEFEPELHWTDRDLKAWRLIEARARPPTR